MRESFVIAKKEFKHYFTSPIGYIIITIFLLMTGYFFTNNLFLGNQASMRSAFEIMTLVFLFFIPALTMSSLAEEKRVGTIELITTMPISEGSLILGKFLAALSITGVTLALTLFYVFSINQLSTMLDTGPVVGGYVGMMFLASAYISMGIFASAITRDQIVSFIISFAIIFMFFMIDKVLMFVSAEWADVFQYISTGYHFSNIQRGIIDSRNIIYFVSLTTFFLFMSVRIAESRKWS